MRQIQLRDAKASVSAIVDEVSKGEVAIITRHGKPTAVLIDYREWQRLIDVPSFGAKAWFGWPDDPELERLRTAWFGAPDREAGEIAVP
jgi:prevent-host-death family protein